MIVFVNGTESATTNGCGCCSATYAFSDSREEIASEVKKNIAVAIECCAALGISFSDLVEQVKASKK